MESIIKKAIEGGYKKERYYFDENGNFDDEPYEVVLMKSSFWQALGKACGWDKEYENKWMDVAHEFYAHNLVEGWNKAVEWLEELVK